MSFTKSQFNPIVKVAKNNLGYILLLLHLSFCLSTIFSYGAYIDDGIERKNGIITYEYIERQLNLAIPEEQLYRGLNISTYDHREYGTLFQTLCFLVEKNFHVQTYRNIFLLRHMLVSLIFVLAAFTFYQIIKRQGYSSFISGFVYLCLIVHPRIFAQSLVNTKDILFLSVLIFTLYTVQSFFFSKSKVRSSIWVGFSLGALVSIRLIGIYILPILILWILLEKMFARPEKPWWKVLYHSSVVTAFTLIFSYMMWPSLWERPFPNIIYSIESLSDFPWNGSLLFNGRYYSGGDLPLSYLFQIFSYTTPLFIQLLISAGIIYESVRFRASSINLQEEGFSKFCLLLLLFPIILYLINVPTVYNGWRHFYFLYPLMLLQLYNLLSAVDRLCLRTYGLRVLLLLQLMVILVQAVLLGPYSFLYLNEWVNESKVKEIELDYFGLGYFDIWNTLHSEKMLTDVPIYETKLKARLNALCTDLDQSRMITSPKAQTTFIYVHEFNTNANLDVESQCRQPDTLFSKSIYNHDFYAIILCQNE